MIDIETLKQRLNEAFPGALHLEVDDLTGTQDHYAVVIVTSDFENLGPVEQHKLVYSALGELMDGAVHALSLQTFTPGSWAARGQSVI
ncbi:MAG: BolA family transcriptional regulator [Myxococcales bacterium]|nr:BolA family transcriptional regulator [Myxococcales bacterium]